ncbi:unnamed protein product [Albugo candida]|uniref:Uncharacterized protein n=1 Tax=Albugo candida TaxID=65357 RepID=A0A024FU85_9STRA|nr:unnamed protein product [Albugo candida]|eukprot:CCI10586.1 unnamed protein product [Albugo candida]
MNKNEKGQFCATSTSDGAWHKWNFGSSRISHRIIKKSVAIKPIKQLLLVHVQVYSNDIWPLRKKYKKLVKHTKELQERRSPDSRVLHDRLDAVCNLFSDFLSR